MTSLREILRAETNSCHERITAKLDLARSTLTLHDYRMVLQKLYGLLKPIENRISQRSDWDIPALAIKQRLKSQLIAKDLLVLGVDSRTLHAMPTCGVLPAISTFAEMLGCMYVLEGSTLGGQFLTQHFHHKFRITSETGCSYFSSYGPRIFEMWSQFVEFLNNYGTDNTADATKVAAGAVETFHAFERWLT